MAKTKTKARKQKQAALGAGRLLAAVRQIPLPSWRRLFSWGVRFGAGALLLVHLYGLLLCFVPAPSTVIIAQHVFSGQRVRQDYKPLRKISPHLIAAVIAGEDAQFCTHDGVDIAAISSAVEEWRAGKRLRGASTITQQTAKNVFFWNGGGLLRKGMEAWMALYIDTLWGKRRVMEMYLNVAEWGDGLFGAEAAARARFDKAARDLTAYEAALLAAVLPSPDKWRVDPPGPYVRSRAATLQARMTTISAQGLANCVLLSGR